MRWTQHDVDEFLARQRTPDHRGLQTTGSKPIASPAPPPKATRPKYGNTKVTDAEGNVHDSTKEYRRWCELELRARAGEISQLHRQPVFEIVVNGVLVCRYIADASYVETASGRRITEDCKSAITRKNPVYRLKAKLLKATHGITITEV